MHKPPNKIIISEEDPNVGEMIESELLKSLRSDLPQSENVNFVLAAKDERGAVIGGMTASASYGWLLVKTLWVSHSNRHQGIGRSLMERAERKARTIGCHSVWLDTSNPDAMRFYAKRGYETFGQLANAKGQQPNSHRRWFMKKKL